MDFLIQNGFDIRKDREAEFQPWLADNEAGIAEACPEGVEYVGTFVNIFGGDDHVGAYRSVWLMDSYGAMDRFSSAIKEGGTFAELMNELGRFAMDRQDGGSLSSGPESARHRRRHLGHRVAHAVQASCGSPPSVGTRPIGTYGRPTSDR